MPMTIAELREASREEIVQYLEMWGFQCYDHESTSELRQCAIETAIAEEDNA